MQHHPRGLIAGCCPRQAISISSHVTSANSPHQIGCFQRRAATRYRLRFHRVRSVVLTQEELVEIRAAQRTFDGAYIRTSVSQLSFALTILKIFTAEFYSIGALFAVYGAGVFTIGLFRRQRGNRQFFAEIGEDGVNRRRFQTSGNVVVVLTALSVAAYICLLALAVTMDDSSTLESSV